MLLSQLFSVALFGHIYHSRNRRTLLTSVCQRGICTSLKIYSFQSSHRIYTASTRKVKTPGEISCSDDSFSISKPALTLLTSPVNTPVILVCRLGARIVRRKKQVLLPVPLKTGSVVTVIGTPTGKDRINIYQLGPYGRPLIYTIAFEFGNLKRVVARNTMLNRHIGRSETSQPYFPYEKHRESNTTIVTGTTKYEIFVDGAWIFNFKFRVQDPVVDTIRIDGEMVIKYVAVT